MNKFRMILLSAALSMTAGSAFSQCYGSDTSYTCYDSGSGNSYSVNRFGGTTYMQGSNARTGSNWSQTTTDQGFQSNSYGTGADGSTWSYTQPTSRTPQLGYGVGGGNRCTPPYCY